ncbi:hypothetical protein VTL71DRAFT_9310 [Oculimacula yallundae]|uniref:GPI anchored protein n=1 Tax=Oculimacula yallundae TaxID=86028 RepID=A0ABR4BSQ9_9HELO
MKSFSMLALPIVALATLAVAHEGEDPLPTAISVYLPSNPGFVGSTVVVIQGSDTTSSTTLQPSSSGPASSFIAPTSWTDSSIVLTLTSSVPVTDATSSASSTVTEVSVYPSDVSSTSVSVLSSTLVSSTTVSLKSASTSTATTVSSSTAIGAGATPTMGAGLLIGVAAGVLAIL